MTEEYYVDTVYALPRSTEYSFYLDDAIGEPIQFRELFHVLEAATENDVVKIILNSPGGYLHTTIMLCNGIRDCEGTVVGVLNSLAASGASCVLLACDAVEVKPHSSFMAHTSHGAPADEKLSDSTRAIMHSNKELESFYRDTYEGFFSEEEITDILDGKDIWLYDEEITERLIARSEYFTAQMEEQLKEYEDAVPKREDLKKLTKDKLIGLLLGEEDEQKDTPN